MAPDETEPQVDEPEDAQCARYGNLTLWLRLAEAASQVGVLAALTLTGPAMLIAGAALTGSEPLNVLLYLAPLRGDHPPVGAPLELAERVRHRAPVRARGAVGVVVVGGVDLPLDAAGGPGGHGPVPLALELPWWPEVVVPWFALLLAARAACRYWVYPLLLQNFYPTRLLRCKSFHLSRRGATQPAGLPNQGQP